MEPHSGGAAWARHPLVSLLVFSAAGIWADSAWSLPLGVWAVLSCSWLIAAPLALACRFPRAASLFALLAAGGLAGGWHAVQWRWFPPGDLAAELDQLPRPVCVELEVETEPESIPASPPSPLTHQLGGDQQDCLVRIRAIRDGQRWRAAAGRARLCFPALSEPPRSGDLLRVLALANRPAAPSNPDEFDGAFTERSRRVLVRLQAKSAAGVWVVHRDASRSLRRWFATLRSAGERGLERHVTRGQAPLAAALLLGTRRHLDAELSHTFFVTGLAHLLAISGLNVAIFAYGFWAVVRLGWLPRRFALAFVAGLAIFYAALTGGEAPVVRAAILVVCVCCAKLLARQGMAYNSLAAAGLIVLAVQPASLFQTGTQLSFLAVAVLCSDGRNAGDPSGPTRSEPVDANTRTSLGSRQAGQSRKHTGKNTLETLDALLERSRPWWLRLAKKLASAAAKAVWTGYQVWLSSTPLVVWRFHVVSLIALPLNPLVLVPAAVALYAGFATLMAAPVAPPVAAAAGWVCGESLWAIERLLRWGESLAGGHFWMAGPPLWAVLAFYIGLGAATLIVRDWGTRWTFGRGVGWGLLTAAVLGLLFIPRTTRDDAVRVTFIAVGHGTSVLVEWPDGRNLLYDAGRLGGPSVGARAIASTLWSRGVQRLDAVVLSHADTDHYNALPDLLRRFAVRKVCVSPAMFDRPDPALGELRRALVAAGVACDTLRRGDMLWDDHHGRIRVLHPEVGARWRTDNAASIVLAIETASGSVLLPGDLEGAGLRRLLEDPPQRHTVAMAPHHGSVTGGADQLIEWSDPAWVVISGSASRGAPLAETAALSDRRWLFTARDGAIHFRLGGGRVEAWTWRGVWQPLAPNGQ
jgi:competence protein ComEC